MNKYAPEAKIINDAINRKFIIILSSELLEQIKRVAERLRNKDYGSYLASVIWGSCDIKFASDAECMKLKEKFGGKLPRKDLGIFAAAVACDVDYLISNNRKFIKQASEQHKFKCVTPHEFLKQT